MNEVFFFSKSRNNVKVKPIESHKPIGRCQAYIILLQHFVWAGFKNIFTMMDNFTKYGWVIPLNVNKAETILTA